MKKCLSPVKTYLSYSYITVAGELNFSSHTQACNTCSQSRKHLNRTCLTNWSRWKDPQNPDIRHLKNRWGKDVNETYQSGKSNKASSKALGLPEITESHYLQITKTCTSEEPSHEWLAELNYPKSAATTHSRGYKKPYNTQRTEGLTWHHEKDTGQKEYDRVPSWKPLPGKKKIRACLSFALKHLDHSQDV